MTTTGTFNYNPSLGDVVLNAYGRIGVRRTSLLAAHMQDARTEANLLQAEWNNRQVNLWEVSLVTQTLTQGVATYSVTPQTVMILDMYINSGGVDYIIFPISRSEYAAIPNKTQQGRPTQFWFDRLETPNLNLWMVPDGSGPYVMNYYCCTLIQDADLANATGMDIPQLWLDAFTAGLAFRLSRIYAPQLRQQMKMDYDEAWNIAATQNVENTPLYITPGITGYYR